MFFETTSFFSHCGSSTDVWQSLLCKVTKWTRRGCALFASARGWWNIVINKNFVLSGCRSRTDRWSVSMILHIVAVFTAELSWIWVLAQEPCKPEPWNSGVELKIVLTVSRSNSCTNVLINISGLGHLCTSTKLFRLFFYSVFYPMYLGDNVTILNSSLKFPGDFYLFMLI